MPRSGSGVYTLPPTNPVVPSTTIATNWANPTLSDIATALTESLDRGGRGGMTAPFRVADGIISAPGMAFTNETNLGLWRSIPGVMNLVANGANLLTIGPDHISSPVRQDFYGFTTYRLAGTYNWKVFDDSGGIYRIQPSTTVNGDTYDAAKGLSINPTTGLVTASSLNVVGAITAGTWTFTDVNANTVTATTVTADYLQAKQTVIAANVTAGAAAVNFAASQSWVMTLAGPLTITSITGLTIGNIGRITFKGTANAVTFPATVKWPGPTFAKPDFAAGPLDICVVVLEYDGTNFLANAAVY